MAVSQKVIKTLHDQYSKIAISIFNDGNEVTPQCILIGLDDDVNVINAEPTPPELMRFFFGSEHGKNVFAIYLRDLLDDNHEVHQGAKTAFGFAPKAIVQINEAWMRMADKDGLDGPPPSQHPDRKEVILVSIHTREGTTINMHKIMDQPKRHAVFSEIRFDGEASGRFAMQDAFGSRDNPVH